MNALERQFAQTVAEHKSTIYTVCYMFSQDADEVNDLFQEVLVNLWKGFESFEHRSDIRTWIYRVALNTCISLDRKKRRSSEVRLTMDINLFEDRDEDTRQVDMLHKRLSKLQPFDRAIVLLWLENLSYEDIGQIVGITAKNVSVRLFRIREQLKQAGEVLGVLKAEGIGTSTPSKPISFARRAALAKYCFICPISSRVISKVSICV